jgi:hypothetical protein
MELDSDYQQKRPDFCTNAAVLLWELEKKDYYYNFMDWVGMAKKGYEPVYIQVKYILNPRQLCEEFLMWEGK